MITLNVYKGRENRHESNHRSIKGAIAAIRELISEMPMFSISSYIISIHKNGASVGLVTVNEFEKRIRIYDLNDDTTKEYEL